MKILELINFGSKFLKANKIPSHIIDSEPVPTSKIDILFP